jgi:glutathionyl-hydroquinone reductase
MGMLIDGQWEENPRVTADETGHFIRAESVFRDWISSDPDSPYPAEANRYHLYLSYACPWACRTLIFRTLKGLEEVISLSFVEPLMGDQGWTFDSGDSEIKYLYEIYQNADPKNTGKVTVPVLWDKKKKTIVNNESAEIIRMLNSEFNHFAKNNEDYYPEALRPEIDKINAFIYENINNGVYRCGFAKTQLAYEEAFQALFSALDEIERRLDQQPFLVGTQITEADWRLFTTLIRFDVVYVGHFKCNLKRIVDYPNLWNYVRRLYQMPGIKETVNFKHIKEHYYRSHTSINPTGIVPLGPEINYDEKLAKNRTS